MVTITDHDGVEREVRYRRVPGYFNRSTYHVDIDGVHLMDVRRVSDSTWSRSALWSAYRPGPDLWANDGQVRRQGHHLTGDRTRDLAVYAGLRALARL
jgi:hypothetical protein